MLLAVYQLACACSSETTGTESELTTHTQQLVGLSDCDLGSGREWGGFKAGGIKPSKGITDACMLVWATGGLYSPRLASYSIGMVHR